MIHFWYLICLLFLLNNINILFEESYEVVYKLSNQSEPVQYLNCVNLKEIILNKTRIDLSEIENEANYSLRWIQKNKKFDYNYYRLISNNTIDQILNRIRSKNYLIYQNKICFIFDYRKDFELFADSLYGQIDLSYFVFANETFNFLKLEKEFGRFPEYSLITIYHEEYPYSHCTKNYSNFICLNDKIKRKQRLSKYYFRSNENGFIELEYQINQKMIDNEMKTIKECNKMDCKINILFISTDLKESKSIYKSFRYIPKLDFYLQLSGIISLFLNISVYQLLIQFINSSNLKLFRIKLFKFIKSKFEFINLKYEKIKRILIKLNSKYFKLKRNYFKLNYFIILIVFIFFLVLFIRLMDEFLNKCDYPLMKGSTFNKINGELSIVICIPIYLIKGKNYNPYNRSLYELEKDSNNGLDVNLNNIYLEFINKKSKIKWELDSKLVAFNSKLHSEFNIVQRCFKLRTFFKEPKYQSLFSVTKLVIELKEFDYGDIFIIDDNEILNYNSYPIDSYHNFKKTIIERSKLNKKRKCKIFNLKNDNCINKLNCIDKCINRQIYNQIYNLTSYSIINKDFFTDKEWTNLFIRPGSKENYEIYRKIKNECESKYLDEEMCIDIEFKHESPIDYRLSKIKIDLHYNIESLKEEEPTLFKLLLDLLNVQSILFNLNVLKLILLILFLFKLNLNLNKLFKFIIFLICSIGFTIHIWSIVDEIINSELSQSQFYELSHSILMPDLIFCLGFNQNKINPNYKLTYEYLDKITNDLTKDNAFSQIEYLNKSNKWIKMDNKNDYKDGDNFEIQTFYYLDSKCFKIRQNIEYNIDQFYFDNYDDNLVLKIFFNSWFRYGQKFFLFTKTKNKIQFSKTIDLTFNDAFIRFKSYKIRHEITKSDKFNLIKNPLSIGGDYDLNDHDKSFKKIIEDFEKKLNLQTLKLPIEMNSNLTNEIDDDLFIQFFDKLEKYLNQTNSNYDYQRQYAINNLDIYYHGIGDYPDLLFSLSFYKKVVAITYETNSTNLVLNLINALSLWFDLCIFNLHFYLNLVQIKISSYLIYFYRLLLKFRKKIYLQIIYAD